MKQPEESVSVSEEEALGDSATVRKTVSFAGRNLIDAKI